MALIRDFREVNRERCTVHDLVDCTVVTFEADNRKYFQLDTHGSAVRKIPGKTSQSIQLDADGAVQLIKLLRKAFDLS